MEQKIWMECNRLIANAIIYYNTWLLSELLAYHERQGNVIEADDGYFYKLSSEGKYFAIGMEQKF